MPYSVISSWLRFILGEIHKKIDLSFAIGQLHHNEEIYELIYKRQKKLQMPTM